METDVEYPGELSLPPAEKQRVCIVMLTFSSFQGRVGFGVYTSVVLRGPDVPFPYVISNTMPLLRGRQKFDTIETYVCIVNNSPLVLDKGSESRLLSALLENNRCPKLVLLGSPNAGLADSPWYPGKSIL